MLTQQGGMARVKEYINPINFALLFSSGEWNTVL
jgi:hypothetical protein